MPTPPAGGVSIHTCKTQISNSTLVVRWIVTQAALYGRQTFQGGPSIEPSIAAAYYVSHHLAADFLVCWV